MVLVGGGMARQVAMGLGYVYPLYMSTEALRSGKKRELQQWVTFWYVRRRHRWRLSSFRG
jgi:hypothetical protein